jgi:hypothetical protein
MSGHGIVALKTDIAAAVSAVDGVTGYLYAPTVWKPGDAWAQWAGAEPGEQGRYATTFTHTYRVIVVLPADRETADGFADDKMAGLVAAVAPYLTVSEIIYTKLPGEGTQAAYNALAIIGETE